MCLEAEYNGDPIAIGFNPKYVVELLTQMTSDQITIALGGELDPVTGRWTLPRNVRRCDRSWALPQSHLAALPSKPADGVCVVLCRRN